MHSVVWEVTLVVTFCWSSQQAKEQAQESPQGGQKSGLAKEHTPWAGNDSVE